MKTEEHEARLRGLSRGKLLLLALAPSLALLSLALLAAELLLRSRHPDISAITGATEWEVNSWHGLTYFWDQYHPVYGWTNLPGYRSDDRVPFRVTINDQGLRAPASYSPRAAAGRKRIAVFGDSLVFGEEVDDDATLPVHLERALDDVEVLNFGVRGFGLGQMAQRLEREGLGFSPDHVVIVLLIPTDIYRDSLRFFSHNKPLFRVQDSRLQVLNVPVPEASRQPWLFRRSFALARLFARPGELEESDDLKQQLAVTRAILAWIGDLCESRGIDFTLVSAIIHRQIPELRTNPETAYVLDYTRISLRSLGIDLLDPIDFLIHAWEEHGDALAARLAHWSGPGNCLIAEQIAGHLAGRDASWSLAHARAPCLAARKDGG